MYVSGLICDKVYISDETYLSFCISSLLMKIPVSRKKKLVTNYVHLSFFIYFHY